MGWRACKHRNNGCWSSHTSAVHGVHCLFPPIYMSLFIQNVISHKYNQRSMPQLLPTLLQPSPSIHFDKEALCPQINSKGKTKKNSSKKQTADGSYTNWQYLLLLKYFFHPQTALFIFPEHHPAEAGLLPCLCPL